MQKARLFPVTFLYTKIKILYVTQFFMKILKLAFLYKNHETFRYVRFLYTKSQTLSKKQDNLRYVFIYKNPDTLRYAIFHWIFEIEGGGGYIEKQYTLGYIFIFKKQCNLPYVFIYKKPDTLRYIFIFKKQCTLRYVFISKIYPILLIYKYKCTYDQSDQIEK